MKNKDSFSTHSPFIGFIKGSVLPNSIRNQIAVLIFFGLGYKERSPFYKFESQVDVEVPNLEIRTVFDQLVNLEKIVLI